MSAGSVARAAYFNDVRRQANEADKAEALTPFDEMQAREKADHTAEEMAIRAEAIGDWWEWCWEGAFDPQRAFRRFLAVTRLYRPELVGNINIRQAGEIFGQTGAAQSVVERELVKQSYAKAGYNMVHVPGQKGADARAKMAKAQKGNKHRARSVKKTK